MPGHAELSDPLSLSTAAAEAPDRTALDCQGQELTYAELHARVASLATPLHKPGPPVAVLAEPSMVHLELFYAVLLANRPAVLLHPSWSHDATAQILRRTAADTKFLPEVWRDAAGSRQTPLSRPGDQLLISTSGSSGEPKIAVLTRQNLVAAARASIDHLGQTKRDRWLLSLPFAHVGGMSVLTRSLMARSAVVVDRIRAQDRHFVKHMEELGITLLSLVPTQLFHLRGQKPPSSLRAVLLGGAPVGSDLLSEMRDLGWPLLQTYGLTEMSSQVATEYSTSGAPSGMRPLPGVRIRVTPSGQIAVAGPMRMDRYWDSDAPVTQDGELLTGDSGSFSEVSGLEVRGRVDQVIISGGENISPEWVEAKLAGELGRVPFVVVGIPDQLWGQRVVLLYEDQSVEFSEQAWKATATRLLPAFAVPKAFLAVAKLPQTPSHKLDRRAAHQLALRMLVQPPGD